MCSNREGESSTIAGDERGTDMSLHLVLGGVRSGKSRYAQELASSHEKVIYVATANAKDDSMKERVKRHQADRPKSWTTLEAYRDFSAHKKNCKRRILSLSTALLLCSAGFSLKKKKR